jgi:predicted DsbA family dithiol-disulfide isomerase
VLVEIWSDVVCPWCQIGKRRFEKALSSFAQRDEVKVEWRSFELDPTAVSQSPGDGSADYAERLAAKYGTTREQAEGMLTSMTAAAAAEGLDFRFDRAQMSNTFLAHQVIHAAHEHGVQDAVKERLLTAYFTEGEPVGDAETLVRLAAEAGMDAEDVRAALADQRFADAVRADEAESRALGITGVPFFVVDRAYGVSGAQSPDVFLEVLQTAWAARSPLTLVGPAAGDDAACGPEGCQI